MTDDIIQEVDIILNTVGNLFAFMIGLAIGIYNSLAVLFWFLFLVSLFIAVIMLFDIRRLIKNKGDMTKVKK